jgi:hypothetical protein
VAAIRSARAATEWPSHGALGGTGDVRDIAIDVDPASGVGAVVLSRSDIVELVTFTLLPR